MIEFGDASETGDPYRGKTVRLIRLDSEGEGWIEGAVLVPGLPFPTALLIDATDRLYISVHGAFSSPGSGLVIRFDDLTRRTSDGSRSRSRIVPHGTVPRPFDLRGALGLEATELQLVPQRPHGRPRRIIRV